MTPLVLNNLGLGEVDKTVLNRIDKTVCTLADNMPHLNKGKVVTKPSFCILSYTWSPEEAPRFYLDLDVVQQRILDEPYVKKSFMGSQGLFLHIWKHEALLRNMQTVVSSGLSSHGASGSGSMETQHSSSPSPSSLLIHGSNPNSSDTDPTMIRGRFQHNFNGDTGHDADNEHEQDENEEDERPRKRSRTGSFVV